MDNQEFSPNHDAKQLKWDEVSARVNEIRDGLGEPVDAGIKEAVIAMNVLGFETKQSCEGHLGHGLAGPWIDISADSPISSEEVKEKFDLASKALKEKGVENEDVQSLFREAHSLQDEARRPMLHEADRMMGLLDSFYKDRQVQNSKRIVLNVYGRFTRIQNAGIELQAIKSEEEKEQNLIYYRQEFSQFTEFLKESYFQS